ncbi:hypothetical protein HYO53_22030 [Vibrio parahaemolyticus]|nr:hypothetical protein [Vibrio parahaemolyticus]EGR2885176.1 hypothetical protein [Vibrio parahaemolyticus]EGR2977744.1 hypothetical protein [Vibrio parahaemolyticus]EGR3012979.1 hypothetical protein [Vibrio parahaemolyticus]EJB1760580.1 hypothetical protein [Vibrio parahaemolyticus]
MEKIIDTFQKKINDNFSEFTLATSCAEAGLNLISQSSSDSTVSLYLGDDLYTEPVQFVELLDISSDFISNTVSLYQNMMVAAWSDLLDDLFNYYLDLHFSGKFSFSSLKKQNIKIDFVSGIHFESQIKDSLKRDFAFKNYNDKIKLIVETLGQNSTNTAELNVIRKHVLIRNAVQHHNGVAYSDMFKLLGSTSMEVMDRYGKPQIVSSGEKILISVPEFDLLKRSLQLVTQIWRSSNA